MVTSRDFPLKHGMGFELAIQWPESTERRLRLDRLALAASPALLVRLEKSHGLTRLDRNPMGNTEKVHQQTGNTCRDPHIGEVWITGNTCRDPHIGEVWITGNTCRDFHIGGVWITGNTCRDFHIETKKQCLWNWKRIFQTSILGCPCFLGNTGIQNVHKPT